MAAGCPTEMEKFYKIRAAALLHFKAEMKKPYKIRAADHTLFKGIPFE